MVSALSVVMRDALAIAGNRITPSISCTSTIVAENNSDESYGSRDAATVGWAHVSAGENIKAGATRTGKHQTTRVMPGRGKASSRRRVWCHVSDGVAERYCTCVC